VAISLVIVFSATHTSGAAGVAAPSADSRAQGLVARVSAPEKCPGVRKGLRFYQARVAYWAHKMGAGSVGTESGREGSPSNSVSPRGLAACPRYLAKVMRAKAHAARLAYGRWAHQRWLAHQRQVRLERQHPKWIALRLLHYDREQWGCLLYITDRENKRMDPTLDYGGGHGNVYEAYGIPQATPGYKMRSAGPDWRTNPETQLRWMIAYCKARYGSVCGAAYSRRVYGTY
jgi:hypothetical protein